MRAATMLRVVCILLLLPTQAFARDVWVNPESMGANALPSPVADVPWTQPFTEVTVGAAAQWGRRNDASLAPTFRLALPVGRFATALFDGMPLEAWWSSPDTRAEWMLPRERGLSKADIRFGAKFTLLQGSDHAPTLGIRFVTKTTTGKDYDARRFTDAPAYMLDVAIGQRWLVRERFAVSVYGNLGFFAWQQGADAQNDAPYAAAAVSLYWLNVARLEFETRGYVGWQRGDKTLVTAVRAFVDLAQWCSLGATLNVGFLAAPRIEGRLDVVFRLPALPLD